MWLEGDWAASPSPVPSAVIYSTSVLGKNITRFYSTTADVLSLLLDIPCRLGFPWMLYIAVAAILAKEDSGKVVVTSSGVVCSVALLFVCLVAVVIFFVASRWALGRYLYLGYI